MRTEYTIPVRLDAKTFRRFGNFDMLRLRKKWVRPVLFAVILVAFAFLALLTRKEQSGMIAAVLLVVGLGLPLVYFGSFLSGGQVPSGPAPPGIHREAELRRRARD